MARAETIESVEETGGGVNGPLPRHNTCRMELPRPFHNWPGLLSTATISTGSGAMHFNNNHHYLHPLQALYLSYPLPYPHPEGQDQPHNHQHLPASAPSATQPPPPLCNGREETGRGAVASSVFSGEQSDSDKEEPRETTSRRGPLPDLLPQNEHPSWASPQQRAPRGEAGQEVEVRRLANQLKAIGDEFNATVLHRAHAAPHWRDWRNACRGLFTLVTQTLRTLYRLT